MIVHIFFSLFSSPTKSYGSVSGDFEVPESIKKGQYVVVLRPAPGDWFDGSLKVMSITLPPHRQEVGVELDGIVAQSSDDAARLGKRFEAEAGLFCDVHD